MNISDQDVEDDMGGGQIVESQYYWGVFCYVYRIEEFCDSKKCFNKCHEDECRDLCAHLCTCTCPDKDDLCQHIHKVHSFLLRKGKPIITKVAPIQFLKKQFGHTKKWYKLQENKDGERHEDFDFEVKDKVDGGWTMPSEDYPNVFHSIHRVEETCYSEYCFRKCLEDECLGLCRDLYTCTCPDDNDICQHIHKIHSVHLVQKKILSELHE